MEAQKLNEMQSNRQLCMDNGYKEVLKNVSSK